MLILSKLWKRYMKEEIDLKQHFSKNSKFFIYDKFNKEQNTEYTIKHEINCKVQSIYYHTLCKEYLIIGRSSFGLKVFITAWSIPAMYLN